MGRARRNDSSCRNLGWTASHQRPQLSAGSNYVTAGVSPPQRRDVFLFIFKCKNGSGEMGAKVDPAVSSGCCGAPSQTRLDFSACGNATSPPRDGEIIRSHSGEITGAGAEEITELPLWPKNCASRRSLWNSPGFHPAEDAGDFPVNCFIGRLLFACCFFFFCLSA